MFQRHPTTLIGGDSQVQVKGKTIKDDLALVREGELHTFMHYAFLPADTVDNLVEQLMTGPVRVGDLPAFVTDRRKLLRTLAWLGKFDLVEFQ